MAVDRLNHGGASNAGPTTNRSGTITAGAIAQDVAAENIGRRGFFLQNLSNENMWLNFGSDAVADQPSIRIAPDGVFSMEGSVIGNERISLIAATTGSKFTAKEW